MEQRIQINMYKVNKVCDSCKEGVLVSCDLMLPTDPPKFQHKCLNCGEEVILNKSYPSIEYSEV